MGASTHPILCARRNGSALLALAAPRSRRPPAADSIDHSSVELSADEDTAAPELGASEDATPDLFDHGATDLSSDDGVEG